MKEHIDNPHFYDNTSKEGTFEDLMDQCLGGINKPKMHLWLPSNATPEQTELVKKICGKI